MVSTPTSAKTYHDEAVKQLAFPFTVVNQAAPRPGPFGGAEVVRKSRAQAAEFVGRARKTHVALEPVYTRNTGRIIAPMAAPAQPKSIRI